MKHFIAVILFAILATGCVTQSANPDSNLVARVEQSKDGRISKEEYTTWNVARMFKLYDNGGKGYVTIEDWRRLEGTSRDAQYRRIDTDHNGKITLAEAEANLKIRALLGGNFADIDTDRDGWIDRKEAAAYLARRQSFVP
jgi:EF hand